MREPMQAGTRAVSGRARSGQCEPAMERSGWQGPVLAILAMLARRERRWVRLSRRCGALRVAAGGSAPPLPAAALHGLGVVRPGRENGPPTEPENGFPTGQEADISCASKGGHLYASPTVWLYVLVLCVALR